MHDPKCGCQGCTFERGFSRVETEIRKQWAENPDHLYVQHCDVEAYVSEMRKQATKAQDCIGGVFWAQRVDVLISTLEN